MKQLDKLKKLDFFWLLLMFLWLKIYEYVFFSKCFYLVINNNFFSYIIISQGFNILMSMLFYVFELLLDRKFTGRMFSFFRDYLLISWMKAKYRLFIIFFIFANRMTSQKAGKFKKWGIIMMLFLAKNLRIGNQWSVRRNIIVMIFP